MLEVVSSIPGACNAVVCAGILNWGGGTIYHFPPMKLSYTDREMRSAPQAPWREAPNGWGSGARLME